MSGQHHTLLSDCVNDVRILRAFPHQIEASLHWGLGCTLWRLIQLEVVINFKRFPS